MTKAGRMLAVDLGGTNLRTGSVTIVKRHPKVADVRVCGSPQTLHTLKETLTARRDEVRGARGCAICVGGPVESHSIVVKGPNLPWLDGCPLREELETSLGMPVCVSNDMEAAAHGERMGGALKERDWAIFDTISTGWGGVLVLNGVIVLGEPGHVNTTFDSTSVCGCGNRGCNEALYSGSAMKRRIEAHIACQSALLCPATLDPWDYFYKELATHAEWAEALLAEWGEGVGRAWANVLNRIERIDSIVYMGTTALGLMPRAKPLVLDTMRRICMFEHHRDDHLAIVPATYKERSLVGAALIFREESRQGRA